MTETFYEQARRLMRECPRHITLTQIANETGLSKSWLSEFSNDKVPEPSVHKIQTLVDYLSVQRPIPAGKWLIADLKDHLPDNQSTVYVVYADEEIIYIGQTANPKNRLRGHNKLEQFKLHGATHISLIFLDEFENNFKHGSNRQQLEKELIKIHNPKLNRKRREVSLDSF